MNAFFYFINFFLNISFDMACTVQQMKKIKQTEEDLLYGTIIRTPTKRRLAGTPTPGKTRKVLTAYVPLLVNQYEFINGSINTRYTTDK